MERLGGCTEPAKIGNSQNPHRSAATESGLTKKHVQAHKPTARGQLQGKIALLVRREIFTHRRSR
jgi:hypothetical protein